MRRAKETNRVELTEIEIVAALISSVPSNDAL